MIKLILFVVVMPVTTTWAQQSEQKIETVAAPISNIDNTIQADLQIESGNLEDSDESMNGFKIGIRKNFELGSLYTSSGLGIRKLSAEDSRTMDDGMGGSITANLKMTTTEILIEQRLGTSIQLGQNILRLYGAMTLNRQDIDFDVSVSGMGSGSVSDKNTSIYPSIGAEYVLSDTMSLNASYAKSNIEFDTANLKADLEILSLGLNVVF